jgi:hypothetical protein
MRIEEEALRVSSYRPEERLHGLDALIDVMTANSVEERPSMDQVIQSLEAYLHPPGGPTTTPDLNKVAQELEVILEPSRRRTQEAQSKQRLVQPIRAQLNAFQNELIQSLKTEGVPTSGQCGDFVTGYAIRVMGVKGQTVGGGGAAFGNSVQRPAPLGQPNSFYLASGVSAIEVSNNTALICAGHIFTTGPAPRSAINIRRPGNAYPYWFEQEEVIIGTDAVANAIERLAGHLRSELPGALAELVAKLNEYDLR